MGARLYILPQKESDCSSLGKLGLNNAVDKVRIVDCFVKSRKYVSVEETRSATTHEFHPRIVLLE